MRCKHLLLPLVCLPFAGPAQDDLDSLLFVLRTQPPDTNRLQTLLMTAKTQLDRGQFNEAREHYTQCLDLATALGARAWEAHALRGIGITHYYQGRNSEALVPWERSLAIFVALNDSAELPPTRMNMANAYVAQGDHSRAQKSYYEVLAFAERTNNQLLAANCLTNLAWVANLQGRKEEAADILQRELKEYGAALSPDQRAIVLVSLAESQMELHRPLEARRSFEEVMRLVEEGRLEHLPAEVEAGLGLLAQQEGDRSGARAHFLTALQLHSDLDDIQSVAVDQVFLGDLDLEAVQARDEAFLHRHHGGSSSRALAEAHARIDSALTVFKETNDANQLHNAYRSLSAVEQEQGDYRAALAHHQLFKAYSDSLLNSERDKKLTEAAMAYAFEKKEAATKAAQERKDRRQRLVRNGIAGGLTFALLFLGVLWRQRNKISAARKRSDDLLLNILPEEVAAELKATGEAGAKHFDNAVILFSDFKGFTQASEKLTPQELVEALNVCFKAFDHITAARGIEKIKTIGDAYMCAGGLPDPKTSSPADVVHAALEMQAFMRTHKAEREAAGKPYFEMRVGIHSGPVVAGIVGVKKFQYDIWGDTVNTASRMESSGEVGLVNISEATYELVKDEPSLTFIPRGKVQAKGKGEMEMYFVRRSMEGAPA